MNIEDAKNAISIYMEHNIPCFMWGAPGVGKSDAARQVAKDKSVPIIDFRAILRDPIDLRGLPSIDAKSGTAKWLPPNDLPNEKRDGKHGILFMDELNAAPQSVQAACFGLVLDRKVGEYQLPDGWRIIAAGNRQSDGAAAQRMPTALANRFAHIDVEADVDTFSKWAATVDLAPEVVAFLRFRPALLHDMTPQAGQPLRTFPTPRAWASVAKVAGTQQDALRLQLVKGLVGEAAAVEFDGFLRIYQTLPSIDSIFAMPAQAQVPNESAARYALATGVARRVSEKTFSNAIAYMKRLPKEFEVAFMCDTQRLHPKLAHTKAYTAWAVENESVLL